MPTTQPNILFVFTDQQRSTALGCAGVENVRTPHLDAFAAQGTRFTRCISNTPVCTPARGTILTGTHVLTHQNVNNDKQIRTDLPTVARSLNDAGYRCGYVGKWHLGGSDRSEFIPPGERRLGFDDFWAACECNHSYFGGFYQLDDDPTNRWVDGYEPDHQTDLCIDYMKRCSEGDQPFCLFLSWGPPHDPYREVPRKYLDMYPPEDIELLPNVPSIEKVQELSFPGLPEVPDLRSDIAGYYAHMTALDDCWGRLMAALEEQGIADNTIVLFTSDHGDMLGSNGFQRKGHPHRESANVPLLVRWPGHVPPGRVSGKPISLVDFAPTLLGLTGVEIPDCMEGRNNAAFVLGDDSAAAESVHHSYPVCPAMFKYDAWRGVVTERYTYARDINGPWVLFDDIEDPFQMTNLVDDPAHAGTLAEMERLLGEWLEYTNDPFEPSGVVADKYYPTHVDGVAPFQFPPEVRARMQVQREKNIAADRGA